MSLPVIFMYSGQGSQYYQMGRTLFNENKFFKDTLIEADDIHKKITGHSVLEILYSETNTKSQIFSDILLTHPAIFMLEYALTQLLLLQNIHPVKVLGTSMGEFACALTAGATNLESTLEMVIQQAQIIHTCDAGGMLAILDNPSLFQKESYLNENAELAGINFDKHFVVSGKKENLSFIVSKLKDKNISHQLLPVTQAFHSRWIDSAKVPLLETIKPLKTPQIPWISCANKQEVTNITVEHFWHTVREPIWFQSTIQALEDEGPSIYIDLGPSGTLATFVKYNLLPESKSKYFPTLTPFGNDSTLISRLNGIQ